MNLLLPKNMFPVVLGACLLAEAVSFAAFFRPALGVAALIVVAVLALWLSLKDLRYGLLLVVAELCIGSQGYLFSAGLSSSLSLRMTLWIIVMAVWIGQETMAHMRQQRRFSDYWSLPYAKPLLILGLALLLGVVVGLVGGNDTVYLFLEAKRWAYIALLLPLLSVFRTRDDRRILVTVAVAAAIWLALKTMIFAYIFTHGFAQLAINLYDWSRHDLLAEITRAPSGFFRIFMQSQIFLIPAFLTAGAWLFSLPAQKRSYPRLFLAIAGSMLLMAAILASLSRSFWVGLAFALIVVAVVSLGRWRTEWKMILVRCLTVVIAFAGGLAILFAVVRFPFPAPSATFDASLLSDRATQMEAGAASRWSLLPVMGKEAIRSPLWGHGFGKTLTYVTSDPRITSTTADGSYTTYAFEWGWLDIALKLGVLGLAAYLWLFFVLLKDCWCLFRKNPSLALTAGGSLLALAAAHFFTPYLNHPLGFIYLGIIMAVLHGEMKKKQPEADPLSKF